jgi:6-phosphogluconolactonase
MNHATSNIRIFPDLSSLSKAAADHIRELARAAIQARGRFSLVLSGGSTPKMTYDLLTQAELDWTRIHAFFGDERCVPPDHPDSNYRMARQTLLDHVPIPDENVHRMRGEISPERAAAEYEQTLRDFFHAAGAKRGSKLHDPNSFDLVLLGLGEDGHTASLFPGSPALQEKERWVVAIPHDGPPPPQVTRISLTLPVINAAAQVNFLVAGEKKADILKCVLAAPSTSHPMLPAQMVHPSSGNLHWLIDRAAKSA